MKTIPNHRKASGRISAYISLSVILLLVAAYFFLPAFGETTREAWQILRTGDQHKISEWVKQFGFWGPSLIIAFMVVQMFLVVVNVVALVVISVLAYGPVWGSLIAFSGIVLASCIGFAIGRFAGASLVTKLLGSRSAAKVESQVDRYGMWAVVVARVSPFISNDAISFIAGSMGLSFTKFIAATVAGITPLILLIAYLGEDIDRLKTGLLILSGLGIVAFLAYYFYDRRKHSGSGK